MPLNKETRFFFFISVSVLSVFLLLFFLSFFLSFFLLPFFYLSLLLFLFSFSSFLLLSFFTLSFFLSFFFSFLLRPSLLFLFSLLSFFFRHLFLSFVHPVVPTRNSNNNNNNNGRDEMINHIISELSKLAQREYKTRHDLVGRRSTGNYARSFDSIMRINGICTTLNRPWEIRRTKFLGILRYKWII